MTRGEFMKGALASAAVVGVGNLAFAKEAGYYGDGDYPNISPDDFSAYLKRGSEDAALKALDVAFEKVMAEAKKTVVTDVPAVWLVYNMGLVIKTKESCFAVDLMHRLAAKYSGDLDFALITHNHSDHYTKDFYRAMDGSGKTVISNFLDNYGVRDRGAIGGYTRARKTFRLKDVEISTRLTDHNSYLIDFTTAFEIKVGEYVIFHSGDCSNAEKLRTDVRPDMWIVHPRCGMDVASGYEVLKPKLTVVAHLNELLHGNYRWTWKDGKVAADKIVASGGKSIVPRWGERII